MENLHSQHTVAFIVLEWQNVGAMLNFLLFAFWPFKEIQSFMSHYSFTCVSLQVYNTVCSNPCILLWGIAVTCHKCTCDGRFHSVFHGDCGWISKKAALTFKVLNCSFLSLWFSFSPRTYFGCNSRLLLIVWVVIFRNWCQVKLCFLRVTSPLTVTLSSGLMRRNGILILLQ